MQVRVAKIEGKERHGRVGPTAISSLVLLTAVVVVLVALLVDSLGFVGVLRLGLGLVNSSRVVHGGGFVLGDRLGIGLRDGSRWLVLGDSLGLYLVNSGGLVNGNRRFVLGDSLGDRGWCLVLGDSLGDRGGCLVLGNSLGLCLVNRGGLVNGSRRFVLGYRLGVVLCLVFGLIFGFILGDGMTFLVAVILVDLVLEPVKSGAGSD